MLEFVLNVADFCELKNEKIVKVSSFKNFPLKGIAVSNDTLKIP